MVASVQTIFDALSAESVSALRVDQRVSKRIQTDGTAQVIVDNFLEQ
jgi:hypothetical protein